MAKTAKVVPLRAPETEDDIALSFERENADRYVFNATAGKWLCWTDQNYAIDHTRRVFDAIREHARDTGTPKAQSARAIQGIETLCKSSRTFARVNSDFDADPMLLGTPGGTVELRTGLLRPANPADLITRTTTVAPIAGKPTRFLAFLNEATGGDAGVMRFLAQWFGYGLSGSTVEQLLCFFYGDGGTGKSTLINTVSRICGSYAATAPMATFAAAKFDAHPTEIASLAGARIVTAHETQQGRSWDVAKIKQLTGGDEIAARFMRQDFFRFRPEFKLSFLGNHAPSFEAVDNSVRRRFLVIPLDRKPATKDERLMEALEAEAGQILSWMIAGCLDWQHNGLLIPAAVTAATETYFAEQDVFGHWLDECVDRTDHRITTPKARALTSWNGYRQRMGEGPENAKELSERLRRAGFREGRSSDHSNRERVWHGMELRHDHE